MNQIIEHSNLKSLLKKIHQKGAVSVGLEEGDRFINAMSGITDTCKSFSKEDIRKLYREFLLILEEVFITKETHFDASKISSRMLIQQLIGRENAQKFKSVTAIIHIILTLCVKISVESKVESLMSKYEQHFYSKRQLREDQTFDEMEIAENGPEFVHADKLLSFAMDKYWTEKSSVGGSWKFCHKSEDIRTASKNSEVVKTKFPFMK